MITTSTVVRYCICCIVILFISQISACRVNLNDNDITPYPKFVLSGFSGKGADHFRQSNPSIDDYADVKISDNSSFNFYITDNNDVVMNTADGYVKWQNALLYNPGDSYFERIMADMDIMRMLLLEWYQTVVPKPELTLWLSLDNGDTWRAYRHPDNHLLIGGWSLKQCVEQHKTVLYVGLYQGRVMKIILPD